MKQTQENNGLECSKTEYLKVEIHQAALTPHVYLLWKGKDIIAEIVEDDIIKLLDKKQLVDFYYSNQRKFNIKDWKIKNYIDDK